MKSLKLIRLILSLCLLFSAYASTGLAAAHDGETHIDSDADIVASLELLVGDGNGVTHEYLVKGAMRYQAAIISLRLQGLLDEAITYAGTESFSDVAKMSQKNQAILAYLKDHPELGWQGFSDGRFAPLSTISAQQLYKVMLEALGYRAGTDFEYKDTEQFAAELGLVQLAGTSALNNSHIATALVEALSAKNKDGVPLFEQLQSRGVLPAAAMKPAAQRITLIHSEELGTYLADKQGRTLYFFTKDAESKESCQGACITNWPVFHSDSLAVTAGLEKEDFGVYVRSDGTKQLTYKGWPLYYFVKDTSAGEVKGEGVNHVWFVAKPDYKVMLGTSGTLGNYLTDANGRTLYYFDKDPKGSSVCEGQCIVNWPVFQEESMSVPSDLNASDFGEMTRKDGTKQSTYKGYPLYYFIKDANVGDVVGQNVNNVWFVIDPAAFQGTKAEASIKTYRVDIKEFSFGSEPLTVEAGSRIIFTNYDSMKHNAVAKDGSFSTPLLAEGESFEVILTKAGEIEYFCEPHKDFMTGKIIVK